MNGRVSETRDVTNPVFMLGVTPALVRHPTRGSVTFRFIALELEHTTQTPNTEEASCGFLFFPEGTQVPWDGWVVGSMSLIFFLSYSDRTCICLSSCICVCTHLWNCTHAAVPAGRGTTGSCFLLQPFTIGGIHIGTGLRRRRNNSTLEYHKSAFIPLQYHNSHIGIYSLAISQFTNRHSHWEFHNLWPYALEQNWCQGHESYLWYQHCN